jgi:hypothetical protein
VAKWRRRTTTSDLPIGPRRPRSSVLTEVEEAMVVEFRRRTLLPLDDVLGRLRDAIPRLSAAPCTAASSATASPACRGMTRRPARLS